MSPDAKLIKMANTMSMYENIIILCGHYKGVDQRVRPFITKEISRRLRFIRRRIRALVLSDALTD
jgi:tRNA (guanine37-N1)-methyltransferase